MHGGKAKLKTSRGRTATMLCSDPALVTEPCSTMKLVELSSSFPWDLYFPTRIPQSLQQMDFCLLAFQYPSLALPKTPTCILLE